jgi:PTS system mannose-specific IID component
MPGFGRVLARLFTIQAAWNYERMQGVGFGHAAEPALRSLDGGAGGERYKAALARQTRFFNAHPYFAGLAVGASVRAELDGEQPERIERLREALCGPLGSIGDRLFWASWLPTCAAAAVVAFVFGARIWAAVLFLALYNAAHLVCRVWALRAGWERGLQVAGALSSPALRWMGRVAAPLASVLVGAALPLAFVWQLRGAAGGARLAAALGVVVMAVLLRVARARAGGVVLAAVVLAVTGITGWLWW